MQQGALGEQQEAYVKVEWDLGSMLQSLRAGAMCSDDRLKWKWKDPAWLQVGGTWGRTGGEQDM